MDLEDKTQFSFSKNMSNNRAKVIDPESYRDNLEKLTEILGIEKDYWQCFLESITHSTFIEEKKP